jgi:hypothetical protein
VAINYLAIPLSLAMLAYAAVSFPETTANTLYTVLEFIKEHPTASSAGIIIGAGALLGPDLLAGTAVAGVCRTALSSCAELAPGMIQQRWRQHPQGRVARILKGQNCPCSHTCHTHA